jgi:TRAP-type mannitol/chloroaromatic compound transport system substrate-binding protein
VAGTTSPKAPTSSSWQGDQILARRERAPSVPFEKETIPVERRRFIVTAGGTLAVAGAAVVVEAPHVIAQPKVQWRMSTTWSPANDVLQGSAQQLGRLVDEMSGGRFKIEVFPGGQIMPPLACFDAASHGTDIQAFMGVAYYWADKEPAMSWFANIPFGMNAEGTVTWFLQGGGLKLWEETYAPFNLVPRPAASTGPQMAGWFRRKINTLADFRGLKMRIAGLGGPVLARAGATVVLTPASEVYAALERGVIDASEWVGPHDDIKLGLQNTARYYYYPGWHEPGGHAVFGFNRKAYETLPVDLQRVLDHAAAATLVYGHTEYHAKNAVALERLRTDFKGKVEVLPLPAPVLRDLRKLTAEVLKEESEKSPMARKVHASYAKFQALVGPWDHVAEGAYHQFVAG